MNSKNPDTNDSSRDFRANLASLTPAEASKEKNDPLVLMYRCGFAAGAKAGDSVSVATTTAPTSSRNWGLVLAACLSAILVGPIAFHAGRDRMPNEKVAPENTSILPGVTSNPADRPPEISGVPPKPTNDVGESRPSSYNVESRLAGMGPVRLWFEQSTNRNLAALSSGVLKAGSKVDLQCLSDSQFDALLAMHTSSAVRKQQDVLTPRQGMGSFSQWPQ